MVDEDVVPKLKFILEVLNSNEAYQGLNKQTKKLGLFFFDSCYVATFPNIFQYILKVIESQNNSSAEAMKWSLNKITHSNRDKIRNKQIYSCLKSDQSFKKSSEIIKDRFDFHEIAKQFQVRIIIKGLNNSLKQYEIVGCPITIYILEAGSKYLILNPAYQKFSWIKNDFDFGSYQFCTSLMRRLREFANKGKNKCNYSDHCQKPAIYACRKFDFLCEAHCGTSFICPICKETQDTQDLYIAYQKTYSNKPIEEINENLAKCDRCKTYNQSIGILCKICIKAIAIYYNMEDSWEQEILDKYSP